MKVFVVLGLLVAAVTAQEILQVECGQDAITARFEKNVAETANYEMSDLHFTDPTCQFDEDDGAYYIKRIEPLLSCGTIYTANDTHVTYFNSISSGPVESGLSYPHGIIIGQPDNSQLISVSLTCTYKIDLRVSAAFIPNITYVFIEIPDVDEFGKFKVAMSIYTDDSYRIPYEGTPRLESDGTVYVGVSIIDEVSPDVFLLVRKCWATVFEDPDSDPYYDLITDSCPVPDAIDGSVAVTQNGDGIQALWQTKVFKFVGNEPDFESVWLHCDVTLCIKRACKPECDARRKRRSAPEMSESKTLTIGPVRHIHIDLTDAEEGIANVYVVNNTQTEREHQPVGTGMSNSLLIIIGALAAFCLLCLSMALIIVLMRLKRSNNGNGEVRTTGTINKGFSI